MEYEPGTVLEGTVRSLADFGAFVDLPGGRSGLVHISEVSATYVSDIRRFLTEGQTVRVKVIRQDEKGRLSLSLRQAEAAAAERRPVQDRPRRPERNAAPVRSPKPAVSQEPESFEEKLKHFMADSNSRISGVRQYEHRTRSRKR